ncbi:MAG: dipeptidyl carboxypeptidase II, partial [Gammaproteobacteria bacterium]
MYRILTIALGGVMLAACSGSHETSANSASASTMPASATAAAATTAMSATSAATAATGTNPLFTVSTLPFQAPPFDKITDGDFQPAIEEGMKRQLAEVDAIANNPAPATFDNTLVALEKSGQMLNRVEMIFGLLTSANTDPALQKVQDIEAPKLAAESDAIYLNPKLFARVKTIYNERAKLKLDPESERLVTWYYNQFVHAGANLSDADKVKLKQLNEEAATLGSTFVNKLLAATKNGALVVSDKSMLAGLSDAQITAAADAAKARG